MDTLALTDRDGTYGAVKFTRACYSAGIRPVLGVELAHHPTQSWGTIAVPTRTPVRGGSYRDPVVGGLPRVTFLASADGAGGGRAGWAALCRLVSATHLSGERGLPVVDFAVLADQLGEQLAAGHLMVLLGPSSELARAATRRRDDLALATLEPWRALVPRTHLQVELVSHRLPGSAREGWGPGTTSHAARMARIARQAGLGTVLSNAVRYADRRDAATVDVLDAARRLVALDRRHVDRGNAEGFLKSGKQMAEIAEEIARLFRAGRRLRPRGAAAARPHPRGGRPVRDRPAARPRAGRGALPGVRPDHSRSRPADDPRRHRGRRAAAGALRGRDRRPLRLGSQGGGLEAARRRAGDDPRARLLVLLPHRRRRHRPDPRDGGALRGPRLGRGQPGQLPARRLRRRPGPAPAADGAVPLAAARGAARHRRRRGVGAAARGLRADPRPLRRGALRLRLDDGHLPRPARRPRRRCRARDAAGGDRHDRQGVPAHPRPRRPDRAARAPRAAGQRARRHPARPDVPARRAARRPAPPCRGAPLRRAALRRHPARPHPGRGQLRRLPDEPVRQGRRRGPRAAQARRARHPDAVLDGPRDRRDPAHRRARDRPRRRDAGAARRPGDLRDDLLGQDPRGLPDRVAGPARAGRQVGARLVRGHHHRHLAVPARAGQERHGHALPRGQAGLEDADLPPRRPAPDPRRHPGRGGLPRAGHRDDRPVHRHLVRRGRREAARARRRRGDGRDQAVVLPQGAGSRLPAAGGREDLEGARGVRVVRLLQGARRGVRAADVPVGLAQGALAGTLPVRGAHPRPGHVPQAADPRRRPPARAGDPRPRRQRQRGVLRRGAGRSRRRRCDARRHPAGTGRGEGDQRRRGRADRGGPAVPLAHRLLAPRPGLPAGRGAAGAGRRLRRGLRHRPRRGRAPPQPGDPTRPAAPGRRARPARPGDRAGRPRARTGRPVSPLGRQPARVAGAGGGRRRGRPQQHRPAGARQRRRAGAAPARSGRGLGARGGAVEGDPGAAAGRVGPAHPRARRRSRPRARCPGCPR